MANVSLIIWTIILGLTIAFIYMVLKKMFLRAMTAGRAKEKWVDVLEYLERLFWPVFILSVASTLILSNTIVGLAICLFTAGVLWKTLNNYFLGLVHMAGKTYKVGQRIRYEGIMGTIKSFNHLTLELELEDGESLDIPYRFFSDATITRISPKPGIMSHTINIPIAKPCNLEKEKMRIKGVLLAFPWVVPSQKIVFEHVADEPNQYLIKVTIHGIDKNHLYKVEQKIKAMYQKVA